MVRPSESGNSSFADNEEGFSGDRYSCFLDHDTWRDYVTAAGFLQVKHYYRPPGLPRHKPHCQDHRQVAEAARLTDGISQRRRRKP
jgi:hypothetical protein